jgi:hypothetical protein
MCGPSGDCSSERPALARVDMGEGRRNRAIREGRCARWRWRRPPYRLVTVGSERSGGRGPGQLADGRPCDAGRRHSLAGSAQAASLLPHLRRDWAHPCRIDTVTAAGLTPCGSTAVTASLLPHANGVLTLLEASADVVEILGHCGVPPGPRHVLRPLQPRPCRRRYRDPRHLRPFHAGYRVP